MIYFLIILRPPITIRTYTLCPYTTLFRSFRPARIGHDAISAEFVAAFLHRQESGGALLYGAAGKGTEFGSSGHVSVERGFALARLFNEDREAMISLGPDNNVHLARAPRDFSEIGRASCRERGWKYV